MAYASERAGESELDIGIQYAARREATRLTRHPAHGWQPHFSPDGRRAYFLSNRDGFGCFCTQPPTLMVPKFTVPLAVTGRRLIFNAGEVTGNIWQGDLG